jgi:hypothetical protein
MLRRALLAGVAALAALPARANTMLLGGVGSGSAASLSPPNAPAISAVAPVNNGTTTELTVTWAASAIDGTHSAATGYNLQYSVHGANSWTTVAGVTSGVMLTGLITGTSYDVQVQGTNASPSSPGSWSASTTSSTYATLMTWKNQGPNPWLHTLTGQIVQVYCTPNPSTSSSGGVDVYWSTSPTTNNNCAPAFNRTIRGTGGTDSGYPIQTNVWGCYLSPPTTPGTYYIWAQTNVGDGGLVSAAVTVT